MSSAENLFLFSLSLSIVMFLIFIEYGKLQNLDSLNKMQLLLLSREILHNSISQLKVCYDNCSVEATFPIFIIINKTGDNCLISDNKTFLSCYVPFNKTFYINGTRLKFYLNNTDFQVSLIE